MFSSLARLSSVEDGDFQSVSLGSDSVDNRQAAIAKLRQACRSEVQMSKAPPLPTGFAVIDESLGGGLPRGQIVEAVGKVGRLSLALSVLAKATQQKETAVFIDGADALDPGGAMAQGIDLRRLLWARVKNGNSALRAADLTLGAGGVSLIVLYLVGVADAQQLVRAALWSRLQHRAQRAKAALLVVTEKPLAQSFAVATLGFVDDGMRWQAAPGGRLQLCARQARIEVLRSRLGAPGDVQPFCLAR
ncbi:MAG TPA: hypothetical protein PKI49_16195 [Pseudomonadota bacterium]|nr:hypothetical protein [Pseudomonadota bacterium]HNO70058.1 hypothetical protein [Pseudomonadota bacterium]